MENLHFEHLDNYVMKTRDNGIKRYSWTNGTSQFKAVDYMLLQLLILLCHFRHLFPPTIGQLANYFTVCHYSDCSSQRPRLSFEVCEFLALELLRL